MPLRQFSLLWGRVIDVNDDDRDDHPHYRCQVLYDAHLYCAVSINVASSMRTAGSNDLRILLYRDADLEQLPPGVRQLARLLTDLSDATGCGGLLHKDEMPAELMLDYVRGLKLDPDEFKTVRPSRAGPGEYLFDLFTDIFDDAIDPDRDVIGFFYGERWANLGRTNRTFAHHFRPDIGLHDIHMNQGHPWSAARSKAYHENGPFQDGAFFLWDRYADLWTVFFSTFSAQVWDTDAETGRPLDLELCGPPGPTPVPTPIPLPPPTPLADRTPGPTPRPTPRPTPTARLNRLAARRRRRSHQPAPTPLPEVPEHRSLGRAGLAENPPDVRFDPEQGSDDVLQPEPKPLPAPALIVLEPPGEAPGL